METNTNFSCECCWNDGEIVAGDVYIDTYKSAPVVSYYMDVPLIRPASNDIGYFTQAGIAVDGYYIQPCINNNESATRIIVFDIMSRTVIHDYKSGFPTNFHYNSGTVLEKSSDGTNNILYAGVNNQLYLFHEKNGALLTDYELYTADRTIYSVAYDPKTQTLYGMNHFTWYTIELNHTSHTATTNVLFDIENILERYYSLGYNALTLQSMCVKEGIFYVAGSWPNMIFKISTNGSLLGVTSIPQVVEGRPLGELESVCWSDVTQTFILNSLGRSYAVYKNTTDQWQFVHLFLWGDNVAVNNKRMYSESTGSSGVSVVNYQTIVNVVAPTNPNSILGNAYHDGTTAYPFNFVTEALYYCEWCTFNTNRQDIVLVLSGDFRPTEMECTVRYVSRFSLSPNSYYNTITIDNPSNVLIWRETSEGPQKVETVNVKAGGYGHVNIECGTINLGEGSTLTCNRLGTCTINAVGENLIRMGGTNVNVTVHGSGGTQILCPAPVVLTDESTWSINSKLILGNTL